MQRQKGGDQSTLKEPFSALTGHLRCPVGAKSKSSVGAAVGQPLDRLPVGRLAESRGIGFDLVRNRMASRDWL